jgi:hypothetical protein
MKEAGFAGAEIAVLPLGLPTEVATGAVRSWGTPEFTSRLEEALSAARELGMRLDFTVGPCWPMASPAVGGTSIALSQHELVYGVNYGHQEIVAGEMLTSKVPAPVEGPGDDARLIAVTAALAAGFGRSTRSKPIVLDHESLVDITSFVDGDRVRWIPPVGGRWLVFGFWARPTRQQPPVDAFQADAPVVDHFAQSATQAATRFLDEHVLPPRLDPLLRDVGGDLFEDSLELRSLRGQLWTPALLEEFRIRRGYDLTPYLPVLHIEGLYNWLWSTVLARVSPESEPDFDLSQGLGRRVRYDYYRTLNELYLENHVIPLQSWANGRGLRYRAQSYGATLDHLEISGVVDVPETEDLMSWFTSGGLLRSEGRDESVDFHRSIAAGAHMQGHQVISVECACVWEGDYRMSLATFKRNADIAFSGGATQLVAHGFAYDDVPGAAWPGWCALSSDERGLRIGFAEAWGTRQPMWRHLRSFADYLARAAMVLRHGVPRVDLAVYRQDYWAVGWPKIAAANLSDSGYTYEFLSPGLLESPDAIVSDGRLAPKRAGYRALVVENESAVRPEVLAQILSLAAAGLPVVLVGALPDHAPGFNDAAEQDLQVRALVESLQRLPCVRQVAEQSELVNALEALGVAPDAALSDVAMVHSVHRAAEDGDYYYFFNKGSAKQLLCASVRGRGTAAILDLWNGTSRELPSAALGERLKVMVELAAGESIVVFVGDRSQLNAESVQNVYLPGSPIWEQELTSWDVEAEDWQPSGKHRVRLHLDGPSDWRSIPELADVSGIATYTTTLNLEPGWNEGISEVCLDLGRVEGTIQVRVNGRLATAEAIALKAIDVLRHLRDGANEVQIEIATTLNNRLVALSNTDQPGVARFRFRSTQPAGLIGPVRVTGLQPE